MENKENKTVQVFEKSLVYWTCPQCGTYNEQNGDKFVGSEIECDNCDFVTEDFEMC